MPHAPGGCYVTARPVADGEIIAPDDIHAVACDRGAGPRLLRLDRQTGEVIARTNIAAGAYIGHLWLTAQSVVRRGDAVHIRVRHGPVEVSREVHAMQSARAGQSFFVIDADGRVFAVPPIGDEQGE